MLNLSLRKWMAAVEARWLETRRKEALRDLELIQRRLASDRERQRKQGPQ